MKPQTHATKSASFAYTSTVSVSKHMFFAGEHINI